MTKISVKNVIFIFVLVAIVIIASSVFFNLRKSDPDLSVEEPVAEENVATSEVAIDEIKNEELILKNILVDKKSDVLSSDEILVAEPHILGEMEAVNKEPKGIGTSITFEMDDVIETNDDSNTNNEEEVESMKGVSTSFSIEE